VSQVQGRVNTLADGLAEGRIVERGEVLVAVERSDYDLAVQRARANIASAEASLAELERHEANNLRSLEVQQRLLAVSQTDLERAEELLDRGTGTRAAVEKAQSAFLAQESAVVNLQNTNDLFPAQRAAAEASLAAQRVALAEAETNLARTVIKAPFRGRVAAISVEAEKFINSGEALLTLHDISAVEITAEVQPQAFTQLASSLLGSGFLDGADIDTSRVIDLLSEAGISAVVRLGQGSASRSYPADLVRFRGTVNEETGTIGFVVRVNDPLLANREANRPPLTVGAFVSVDLVAPPKDGVIAIPRAVLRRDDAGALFVYVADSANRLAIRPVRTGFVLGDRITISEGLESGDTLILSDPRPPIPGTGLILVAAEGGH
jgi:RND family efflux transporter MFP subunit